jgi:hypothetical protein
VFSLTAASAAAAAAAARVAVALRRRFVDPPVPAPLEDAAAFVVATLVVEVSLVAASTIE